MPEAPIIKTEVEKAKENGSDTSSGALGTITNESPAKKWTRVALELFIFLPVSVLVLESFFAIIGVGEQNFIKPDPTLGSVHIPSKIVTWRLEGFSRDAMSSLGWRDSERSVAKPEGTYRVALLGDSQTESLQVPLQKDWAKLAEEQLNKTNQEAGKKKYKQIEVLNFGVSGYSTAQELLQLQKVVLPYKPDLIVVLYSRGDSGENIVDPGKRLTAEPRPFFYLDKQNKLALDQSVLLANKEKLTSNPLLEFLRANSRIYGVWDQTNFQLNLTDKFYYKMRRNVTQLLAKLSASVTPQVVAPQYPEQDALKVTQALLQEINNTARDNGARFVLVTFPDMENVDPVYAQQLPTLRAQSLAQNFAMLELSQPFRDYKGKDALFFQVHFAEGGHKVAARALANYVEPFLNP